jgi:hypothetical protein
MYAMTGKYFDSPCAQVSKSVARKQIHIQTREMAYIYISRSLTRSQVSNRFRYINQAAFPPVPAMNSMACLFGCIRLKCREECKEKDILDNDATEARFPEEKQNIIVEPSESGACRFAGYESCGHR